MTPNDAESTGNTELTIEKVQEIMKRHAEHLDLMHSRFGSKGNSLMRYDADDQALTALKPFGLDLARLCLSLADHLQQARPTMPGELCRHNKSGGVYRVIMRRLAYASLFEGEVLGLGGGPGDGAIVTDDIQTAEQIVIYRRESGDYAHFVRPARLFDSPGRFTRIAQPAEAGDQA